MTGHPPPRRLADVAPDPPVAEAEPAVQPTETEATPATTVLSTSDVDGHYASMSLSRDRDNFTRELLRELTVVLEDAVGLEEAEGFVGLVGGRIGARINRDYREASGVERLDRRQVAAALVDLKRRIEGGFQIESMDDDNIVLTNTACPFGSYVVGQESLCMMTSNVFGRISADNLGYARVELQETIARGDSGCRVVVSFADDGLGREYFG